MTREYRDDDQANPGHYRKDGRECIDDMPAYFRLWLDEHAEQIGWPLPNLTRTWCIRLMMLGFCLGNEFKYSWRKGKKDPVPKEESKIRWYVAMALHWLDPATSPDPRDEAAS